MDKDIVEYMKQNLELDDMELIQELYDEYIQTISERLENLKEALQDNNFQEIGRVAHAMKGCALNIGHTALAVPAKQLEYLGKGLSPEEPTHENCSAFIDRLHAIFEELPKS